MYKIIVCGAMGRMGQAILECALKDKEFEVVGAIEKKNHPFIGAPLIVPQGVDKFNILISDTMRVDINTPTVIEFTSPDATIAHLKDALDLNIPMVIGTTGMSKEHDEEIVKASRAIPIVYAPNMSVGVNLLFKLTQIASKVLSENYDIEISETHHRFKKDAPSGTAKRLAQIIADSLKLEYDKNVKHGRVGITGDRPPKEIGMHCLRAGDIVGEHTILFSTIGERIELTHRAHSRATFALGALKAAKFLHGAKPGLYSMMDVLGFTS